MKTYNKYLAISKQIILLILTIFASIHSHKYIHSIFSIIELLIVYNIINHIVRINKILTYIMNIIIDFIFILQQLILYYTGGYITTYILYNISSFKALGNILYTYIILIIIALIISFIPSLLITKFSKRRLFLSVLLFFLLLIVYKSYNIFPLYIFVEGKFLYN
jgi:hypothetical protein